MLPQDPILLLSVVNTRLRDEYENLDELCASLGANRVEVENKLAAVGYTYDPGQNQFR